MSDLNERITVWRGTVEKRLGRKSADELEDHLRTTIDGLKTTGLPDEELLLLACHRLGSPAQLSAEFTKNDLAAVWRDRIVWMLVGLVPVPLLLTAFRDLAGKIGSASLLWGASPWSAAAVSLILPSLIFAASLASCVWLIRKSPRLSQAPGAWLPASFSRLAALLVVVFLALQMFPGVASLLYGWRGVPPARAMDFQQFASTYSVMRQLSSVAFSAIAAVALAWLASTPRAKRDVVST